MVVWSTPMRLVIVDDAEAVRWYRLVAEQGNASAQQKLGAGYPPPGGASSRTTCLRTCG